MGTISSTPGMRSRAMASSSVSLRVVPPRMPGMPMVSDLPGLMLMMLVPNWENWLTM